MKKNWLSLITAAALLVCSIAGCGTGSKGGAETAAGETAAQTAATGDAAPSGTSDKVVLRVSMNMTLGSKGILVEVLEDVLQDYPGVELQIEETAQDSYVSKMAMDVSTDNVADLVQYWRPDSTTHGSPKYIEKGVFADLSELLTTDTFKDRYAEDAVVTCSVDGKLYAIPMEYSFIMFLANQEILDDCGIAAPETWEELLQSMTVLKEHGYIPWGVSTKAYASAWERPLGYIFSRYATMYGDDGTLNLFAGKSHFTSEEALLAADSLAALVSGNCAEDSMTLDDSQATSKYINTGKACYFINGSYSMSQLSDEIKDKLVAIRFPEIPGAQGDTGNICDKSLTSVFYASTKAWNDPLKQEILTKFFERYTSPEIAERLFVEAGSLEPINNFDIGEDKADRVFLDAKAIADDSSQIIWYLSYGDANKRDSFYSFYTELWLGDITGAEFAEACEQLFYEP